jgi:hypothetical protein
LGKSLLDFNFESLQGFLDFFEGSKQSVETFGMIQVVGVWHNSFIQSHEC